MYQSRQSNQNYPGGQKVSSKKKGFQEENEQIAFMNWCKMIMTGIEVDNRPLTLFELFIHIRNESHEKGTDIQIRKRLARAKQAGYKSGTPDLFLPLPMHGYPGLFIEMKRKYIKGNKKMGIEHERGKVTKKQLERMKIHEAAGYAVKVCEGWEQAKQVTEQYMKGELN